MQFAEDPKEPERQGSCEGETVENQEAPLASLPEASIHNMSLVEHADFVAAFDAYIAQWNIVPRIEIRGDADVVVPGAREGTWKKQRQLALPDWAEVHEWKRDIPLMKIFYLPASRPGGRSSYFWIRPTRFWGTWRHLRLCPPLRVWDAGDLEV